VDPYGMAQSEDTMAIILYSISPWMIDDLVSDMLKIG
jgi:hypothetical protein